MFSRIPNEYRSVRTCHTKASKRCRINLSGETERSCRRLLVYMTIDCCFCTRSQRFFFFIEVRQRLANLVSSELSLIYIYTVGRRKMGASQCCGAGKRDVKRSEVKFVKCVCMRSENLERFYKIVHWGVRNFHPYILRGLICGWHERYLSHPVRQSVRRRRTINPFQHFQYSYHVKRNDMDYVSTCGCEWNQIQRNINNNNCEMYCRNEE